MDRAINNDPCALCFVVCVCFFSSWCPPKQNKDHGAIATSEFIKDLPARQCHKLPEADGSSPDFLSNYQNQAAALQAII